MRAVMETSLPKLAAPTKGKVREIYDLGDTLLLVATDRISAFDVILPDGIPDKGKVLNQISAFWFEHLKAVCPNHMITIDDSEIAQMIGIQDESLRGRSMLGKKGRPLAIECVARGYLDGSWWKEYASGVRSIQGITLPDGLERGSKLPEVVFTPATKATEGHDINISFAEASDIVGAETARQVRDWTVELYSRASEYALEQGLILADTKFEFAETAEGLLWIDEALTPDSSRFWEASAWNPGSAQASFDKQFVRDYLETLDWNKQAPGPALPAEIIAKTRAKYIEAFERLTHGVLAL